jgi:xylose dehydrogenase (NAD/NADP)
MRWGILGLSQQAQAFAEALNSLSDEQLIAIAEQDETRLEECLGHLGQVRGYNDYTELLTEANVNAVYIGLPHYVHQQWIQAAIQAGKHIICEAPLVTRLNEAEALYTASNEANVCLVESAPHHLHPATLGLQEVIKGQIIGDIQAIQISFTITTEQRALMRKQAVWPRSALLTMGYFMVTYARTLLGQAPEHVLASNHWIANEFDETFTASLEYANNVVAQLTCSTSDTTSQTIRVIGSDGVLEIDNFYQVQAHDQMQIRVWRGINSTGYETVTIAPANALALEIQAFATMIFEQEPYPVLSEQQQIETLDNIATIEALLATTRGPSTGERTMGERVCSVCAGEVRPVVLIEDHGPTIGEQPAAVAPGHAHRSLGIVYNEHYPTSATACTSCGHIDLWVDPQWAASLKAYD